MSKYCKVLARYGVKVKRSDPNYKKLLIARCQLEYNLRYGKTREHLNAASAKTLLVMFSSGMSTKPPELADQRALKRKQRKSNKNKQHIKKHKEIPSPPLSYVASDSFLESYEWRKLRYEVLKKYDAKCMLCSMGREDGLKMHVDHIKPRRLHPELALDINNLQILCEACNHGKGNWDETDWRPTCS